MRSFAEFQEQVKEQPDTEGGEKKIAGGLDASRAELEHSALSLVRHSPGSLTHPNSGYLRTRDFIFSLLLPGTVVIPLTFHNFSQPG